MTTSKGNLLTMYLVFEDRLLISGDLEVVGGTPLFPGPHIATQKESPRVIDPQLLSHGLSSLPHKWEHKVPDCCGRTWPAQPRLQEAGPGGLAPAVNKPIKRKGLGCDP